MCATVQKPISLRDQRQDAAFMAQNGDVNSRFGVYKSVCCEYEIVITEGATFPDCPRHPKLTTKWKLMVESQDNFIHTSDPAKKKPKSAA